MEDLNYNIVFSNRRSISIQLSPEKGILLRAPFNTSIKSIEKFVQAKSGWIRKHIDDYSEITRINHSKKYIDGEMHLFMGKEKILRITEAVKPFVSQYDNIIEVGLKGKDNNEKVKSFLDRWYRQKAFEVFSEKLQEILSKYSDHDFTPSKFSVRQLKSRWGSCTSKGNITISSELIKLDEIFSEYVIIHELCHLKQHNHGKEYYRLLGELVPEYKLIRKELRKYITK
jgi:predicted metal-dependent hydrolase